METKEKQATAEQVLQMMSQAMYGQLPKAIELAKDVMP